MARRQRGRSGAAAVPLRLGGEGIGDVAGGEERWMNGRREEVVRQRGIKRGRQRRM